jgi:lysophospholipid acyltransferase (LPLAT)-like uncharacterized protein
MTQPLPSPAPPPRKKRSSGVVIPHAPRSHQRLAAWLVYVLVRSIAATLRYRWNDRSGHFEGPATGPTIYCVWHNRLPLSIVAYYAYAQTRNPTAGMAAMVSASRDGGFLTAILECFGVQPVRGSSSRRGPQALLELTTWAERGYDLAITPDGPRGPRYVAQAGVMSLAQITGLPIIPFSYHLQWKLQLKTWDRLQIPLPFSRCEMNVAKPIPVPREADDAEREALRQQLERTLNELSGD